MTVPPPGGVSRRIAALRPSAPLQISQRAAELREQGRDVIGLGAGEPDFETPECARQAAIAAIESGQTHYTAVAGIRPLREAVCAKLQRDQGLHYEFEQIQISTGAKQALLNAIMTLTDPGDRMLYPAPYWVSYPSMAHLLGLESVVLPTSPAEGFKISPEALSTALEQGVRLFVFNSPANPSGAVYSRQEVEALGRVLERFPDTWVVTDEIYEKLIFDDHQHVSLPEACPALKERSVIVNGVSKAYAMTGWRIGYSAAPLEVSKAMVRVQSHMTSNPTSISQHAALAALNEAQPDVERMREAFAGRRRHVLAALADLPGMVLNPPGGAFYLFPDVSSWYREGIEGSTALCRKILEEVDLALVPGEAFGDDRCIRISYAASTEVLDQAVERLRRFVKMQGLGQAPR